jgi:2,3-bisphosphoglycerate-dependent phosphoglycerate mutase
MKKILLLLLIFTFVFSCKSDKKEQEVVKSDVTTYYLIRHAEKDRRTKTMDPQLTEVGLKRAENWSKVFKDVSFDKIYSTHYKRTQQTAAPTAKSKGLEVLSYDTENLFNEEFKTQTEKQSVLIVGHSNTTPAFVNAIVGKQEYSQINDSDNGKLFIVTIDDGISSVIIEDHND